MKFLPIKRILLSALVVLGLFMVCPQLHAQSDTLKTTSLDEVVVSATRYEQQMGRLPMPITLISQNQIRSIGSMRLSDIMQEQAGVVLVPNTVGQGNGLQLQGFDPAYTLILLDGEPFIGRFTGSLDLSRIALRNVKQIEIVKGPSSSLYGSDALAGVVNIITERPKKNKLVLYNRYGTFQTWDNNMEASVVKNKVTWYGFFNRHSTQGYDLNPNTYGKTVAPFTNYTTQQKIVYRVSPKLELLFSGRVFYEDQQQNLDLVSNGTTVRSAGHGTIKDYNLNPIAYWSPCSFWKTTFRFYTSGYEARTKLGADGAETYYDFFKQHYTRPEIMNEYFVDGNHTVTLGFGVTRESVNTSRYGSDNEHKQDTRYVYMQHEYEDHKVTFITGLRYDNNSVYGSQLSPKLSMLYKAGIATFKFSYGIGFKSPDYRQLYMNFNNQNAGGYTVLGTEVVKEKLAAMNAQGLIASYLFDVNQIEKLKPELSDAFNLGATIKHERFTWDVNLFDHEVRNLIEAQTVAFTTSSQTIFSYRNLNRVFIRGVESSITIPLTPRVTISAGYQLLYAKDKNIAAQVRRGEVFYRNPTTYASGVLKPSDYFGLYNRSRHQGNVKILYTSANQVWSANVRLLYRSRFGASGMGGDLQGEIIPTSDTNGNTILDTRDNFIKGFVQVQCAVSRHLPKQNITLQVGSENLTNYKNATFIPNIPGRIIYGSIQFSLSQKNNSNP